MKIGRLLLRILVGGFFVGHGTQKLFGWFGGYGLEGTAQGFEQLGLKPGKAHATVAGVAEAGGGAALLAGAETPLAAAAITATMLTAIKTVHGDKGPWASNGGYEYNAVLIAVVLALAELGPGPISVDALLGRERSGTGWALAVAGAGVVGALGAHLATSAPPAPAETASEDAAASEPAASGVAADEPATA
ncbi:MAG TPA: DoxX family protein [Solirubrobacteraceae bacterium]|jgi:putative oxidoreductase|nr:DoxX family protein [Solirubrobacteraceae bacterium]